MTWRDAINEGFPSPHEREPASLRNDIADELADHLACSLNRELLRTPDETAARRAVLGRFGNPKTIARQLWWAAMKEIIMKDRVFTVMLIAGVLALMGVFIVPWATQQNRMNEAILEKLQDLATHNDKSATMENWSRVTLRVLEESATGSPVAGVSITLTGNPFQDAKTDSLHEKTNERGEVSFGPIRPGAYNLAIYEDVRLPWIFSDSSCTLYAGQEQKLQFITPSRSNFSDFSVHLQMPEDLRESPCFAVFPLEFEPIVRGDTTWKVKLPRRISIELKTGKVRFAPSTPPEFARRRTMKS